MKRKLRPGHFLALGLLTLATGCGTLVEVPPAHVGKLNTSEGLKDGVIPPSKRRLNNLCRICNDLILVQAGDQAIKEEIRIYMPQDKVYVRVDIRGTVTIDQSEANINKVVEKLSAKRQDDRVSLISINKIYETYAGPVIRPGVRAILTTGDKGDINSILANRDKVSADLLKQVNARLKGTPVQLVQLEISDLELPETMLKAQEATKKREIEIEQAEADKAVRIKEAEANLEVAKKERELEIYLAENQVAVQRILNGEYSEAWAAERGFKVLEDLAASDNKVIILGSDVLEDPTLLLGD